MQNTNKEKSLFFELGQLNKTSSVLETTEKYFTTDNLLKYGFYTRVQAKKFIAELREFKRLIEEDRQSVIKQLEAGREVPQEKLYKNIAK